MNLFCILLGGRPFRLTCHATRISFYEKLSDSTKVRATVKYNPFHLQHRAFPLLRKVNDPENSIFPS